MSCLLIQGASMLFKRAFVIVVILPLLASVASEQTLSQQQAIPVDKSGERSKAEGTAARRPNGKAHVLVIAHRGDSRRAPENTLPAFESAIRAGADLVELDYYHSADGVPVVFHDKELDRTTNAREVFRGQKISTTAKNLAELRKLDAGAWFDRRFAGTMIPTLEEALTVIQARSTTLIERKGGDAATCVKLLERKKLLTKVVVQSFDWDYVAECHRLAPQLRLAALGSKKLTADKLDRIEACGAHTVAWNHKHIRARDIDAIHGRGLKAWVYTVNSTSIAKQLVRDGVDGIITDTPSDILKVVRELAPAK